jgi:hypothetical protein
MSMIPVNSSAIAAVGYDGSTLRIAFRHGGIYDHPGVPYSVYVELMNASSIGSYYARHIRGCYR